MSDKKTLEQIRDNGSKRHCWPREQISDVYEYGYIAGFDASTAFHQERTKKLVEALSDWLDDTEQEMNHQPGWKSVKQALQEWGDE